MFPSKPNDSNAHGSGDQKKERSPKKIIGGNRGENIKIIIAFLSFVSGWPQDPSQAASGSSQQFRGQAQGDFYGKRSTITNFRLGFEL